MTAIIIDTHAIVEALLCRDFSKKQAEGVVEAIQSIDLEQMATKADLRTEIADLKADLLKWLVPILLGQSALIVGLVKWIV